MVLEQVNLSLTATIPPMTILRPTRIYKHEANSAQPSASTGAHTSTDTPPVEISKAHVWKCWSPEGQAAWEPVFPSGMKALTFISENSGWVVGQGGYIAKWDGKKWAQVESHANTNINTVAFISPEDGWAAGDGGLMLHWDGKVWTVVKAYVPFRRDPGLISSNHHGLAFTGAHDGWAAGNISTERGVDARIIHWDGKTWQEAHRESCHCRLTALAVIKPDDIWASGGGFNGVTLHWNGQRWERVENPNQYWLYSISAVSARDVWAAGIDLDENSVVMPAGVIHWDGEKWEAVELPSGPFQNMVSTVAAFSANDVLLAGYHHYHWDGNRWTQVNFDQSLDAPIRRILANDPVVSIAVDANHQKWALTQAGRLLRLT